MISNDIVEKAFREPIIGTVAFSDNEIEYTKRITQKCVAKYCISSKDVSPANDRVVFLGCINALKAWEKADSKSLFSYLARAFGTNEVNKFRIYVCSVIDRLSKTDLFVVDEGKKYYATLLFHSLAPKESLFSFFELCWNIFCNELGESFIPENFIYKKLADRLQELFSEKTEKSDTESCQMKLGSNVYSLFLGIKVMARDKPNLLAKLIERITCIIDKLFYGQKLDHNIDYLSKLVSEWWTDKKQCTFGEDTRTIKRRHAIVTDEKNIILHFRYNVDDGAVLEIPAFTIDIDSKCDVILRIYDDADGCFSDEKMHVRTSGLLCSVKPHYVELNSYQLYKLRLEIIAGKKTVFDSKQTLYRDFIIFSETGKELRHQIIHPGQYSVYCQDSNVLKHCQEVYERSNNIYVIEVNDGDFLKSERYSAFCKDDNSNGNFGMQAAVRDELCFELNGVPYSVIDGDIHILLSQTTNINDYGVMVNGNRFRLGEFVFEESDEWYSFNFSDICEPGEPFKLMFFLFSNNHFEFELYLIRFEEIELLFDRKYYYGDTYTGNVLFKTVRFDELKEFSSDEDQVIVPFGDGELIVDIPCITWKMTGYDEMSSVIPYPLWYENISNAAQLNVTVPKGLRKNIILSNQDSIKVRGNGTFCIGEYLHEHACTTEDKAITVFLQIAEGNLLPLFECCFKEYFLNSPVIISERDYRLTWYNDQYFIGPQNAQFRVDLKSGLGQIEKSFHNLKKLNFFYFTEMSGKCSYDVVYLKQSGFDVEEQVLLSNEFFAGDERESKYKGKTFKLDRVLLKNSSVIRPISWIFLDNIYFHKESNRYRCSLFFMKNGNRIDFYRHLETQIKLSPVWFQLLDDGRIKLEYGCRDDGIGNPFFLESNGHVSPQGNFEIAYFLPDTYMSARKNEYVIKPKSESSVPEDGSGDQKNNLGNEQKKKRAPRTIVVSPERMKKEGYSL